MEGIKFNSFGKCVTNSASMNRMEDANDAIAMIFEGGDLATWMVYSIHNLYCYPELCR